MANAGTKIISNGNFQIFLEELKRVLDLNYISTHRRTKTITVDNWNTDTEESVFSVDIEHGYDSLDVDVVGYMLENDQSTDSLAIAVRILDNNTVRVYSKDNVKAKLILYEICSSVNTGLRIDNDYSNPSSQSIWTSNITKEYIDDHVNTVLNNYLVSGDILNNKEFMEILVNGVSDEIELEKSIDKYLNNRLNTMNNNIKTLSDRLFIAEKKIPSADDIENKITDVLDKKMDVIASMKDLEDLKASLTNTLTTNLTNSITAKAYEYTDSKISDINAKINTISRDIKLIQNQAISKEEVKNQIGEATADLASKQDVAKMASKTEVLNALVNYVKRNEISGLISGDYVSLNEFNNTIAKYMTRTEISTTMGKYVLSSTLTSTLEDYAKKSDISDIVSGDFVTNSQLESAIAKYITKNEVSSALTKYVLASTLTNILTDYAKKEDIMGLVPGDYITKKELETFHTTLLEEVDVKLSNFQPVKAMSEEDMDKAINSVLK